jgi:hypothetical protein
MLDFEISIYWIDSKLITKDSNLRISRRSFEISSSIAAVNEFTAREIHRRTSENVTDIKAKIHVTAKIRLKYNELDAIDKLAPRNSRVMITEVPSPNKRKFRTRLHGNIHSGVVVVVEEDGLSKKAGEVNFVFSVPVICWDSRALRCFPCFRTLRGVGGIVHLVDKEAVFLVPPLFNALQSH